MYKEIKYIGFYDILYRGEKCRSFSLAAAKKMDYICQELNKIGYCVRIISPAHIILNGDKTYSCVSKKLHDNCNLELPPSREASNKLDRIIRVLEAKLWLFNYLIHNTHKGEQVLVYHNYNLAFPLIMAQKIKKFKIILEVEEVYSKVWRLTLAQKVKEKIMLRYARENSLVVSEVLAKYLKVQSPIISYGAYITKRYERKERNDNMIRLVFSGSIDKERGSGFLAVESMKYLPDNYQLFISGTVAAKDQKAFYNEIRDVNEYLQREACIFLGILDDTAYEKLLLSSDIALNPQKDGEFAKYIFPSKILTYICHDLPVVTTRGESIVNSNIADMVTFADGYDAKTIAEAIIRTNRTKKNNSLRLENLRENFREELKELLTNNSII